jgi:hypothetical protein
MFADKKYMGVNLVFRNVLLGTFYNIKEAMTERNSIMNYQHEIYVVSGYSAWDEWETVSQLMKG